MDSNKQGQPLSLDFISTFQTLKWSQKCEIMESLANTLSSTPITNYDYDNKALYEFISKGLKEPNLKVNSAFFQLLITIIPQLTKDNDFKYEIIASLPIIVEKLKEKKDKLTSEIMQILTLLLRNDNFDINDLMNALRNFPNEKSIQYKQTLSEFFYVNLRKTYKDTLIKCCSIAIEIYRNLVGDSNVEIKNCAISSLALIRKRLKNAFNDNPETLKITDANLLAEIEEVSTNINYDTKFDLNSDEEEIEIEVEEEIEEEVEEEEEIEDDEDKSKNNKQIIKKKDTDTVKVQEQVQIIEDKLLINKESKVIDKQRKFDKKKFKKGSEEPFIEIKLPTKNKETIKDKPNVVIKEDTKIEVNNSEEKDMKPNYKLSQSSPSKINGNELHNASSITNNASINSESIINKRESIKINQKISIKKEINVLKSKEPMLNDIDLIPLPGSNISVNENDKEGGEALKGIDEFQKKIDEALRKEQEKMNNNEPNQSTAIQPKQLKKKNEEDEEYSQKAEALLDKSTIDLLESNKWDEKKQGLTLLNEYIKSNPLKPTDRETLFIYIKHRINNFKETNFNILREAYNCLAILQLEKKQVSIVLNGTFEKIADPKLKESLNGLLNKMLETIGVEVILTQLLTLLEKSSKMQVVKEYAAFIEKTIEDYGHERVPIKEVVNMCKTMAANTNPQVRSAATSLLCVLYKYVGNDIKVLIKDIKESTLKIIEAEFDKIQIIDPKTLKAKKGIITETSSSSTSVPKVELIPRSDISKKVTQKLLNDINNGKWQEKKEAIEAIEKIFQDSNMKIVNNGLDPLFNTIKAKLSDGNKNLVRAMVQLLTKLIQAVDSGFKQHTKTVALNLIGNLADKMQLLRDDCQLCIEEWIKAIGFEAFIIFTPSFLKQDNFDMRNELLKIMTKHSDKFHKSFAEGVFKELIPPLLICLQDKNVTVRNQVEDLIKVSLKFISLKFYHRAISEFKPAIAESLKIIIDRVSNEIGVIDELQIVNEDKSVPIKDKTPTKEKPKQSEPIIKKISNKLAVTTVKGVSRTPTKKNSTQKEANIVEPKTERKKGPSNLVPKKLQMGRGQIPIKDDLACCSVILNNKNTLLEDKKAIDNNGIFLPQYKPKPNAKEKRYELDKKSKFNLEGGLFDYIKTLKDQFKYIFTSEFIIKLFNDDVNKIISAIGLIMKSLENEETKAKTIDNMDLLLKQLGWKVTFNQNPSLQKKVLEMFNTLHTVYSDQNIHLNDTEINILFNVFTDKIGSTNAGIRETAKNLISKFVTVITPQKAFGVLIQLIDFKSNIKIKNEIVEICNTLYSSGEIDNFSNSKVAKAIMKAYSAGDYSFKNKILNLVKEVFGAIGEEIWKYVDMSEKDKDALYDKLDVYEAEGEEEEVEDNNENDNQLEDNGNDEQQRTSELSGTSCDTEMNSEFYNDNNQHPSTEGELKTVLLSLTETSNNDKVKSMIALHDIIYKNYDVNEKMLHKSIDTIISTFVLVLSNLFKDKPPKDNTVKYSKYIVTVLGKIVSLKNLIVKVSYNQLKELINIVLSSLLIEKLAELGENNEGVVLLRSLNTIMLKILENCQATDVILILFEVIRNYRNDTVNGNICELGVKCLLKIRQDTDRIYHNLAIDKILRSIHELLITYEKINPDLQIKTKIDQIIINYIRNLLKDLVTIKRESIIEDYIKGVESHETRDKYIKRWIKGNLDLLNKDKQPNSSAFINDKTSSESNTAEYINNKANQIKKSIEQKEENKMKLEQVEIKRPLSSLQNEKLNQLKQKLTNLNAKGNTSNNQNYTTNKDADSKSTIDQNNYKTNYKSFNQIQKKWNDVYKRTQELATTKFDSKPQSKK